MLSSTTPARRRTTALLTALVTLGLVGLMPSTAQAAVAQTLTVTVTGQPAGTTVQVDLYELNARGSSLSYKSSATTSTAGVVTFATTSGRTYSLRASSTANTYSQFLGGGDWQENATLFTTPNATTATRAFPLLGYSTVTGKVTVPAGTTISWGEVQSHELSRSASVDSDVWINPSWASIGADGTVFTSAKSGGTVAGKNIALRTFASTLAVKVTGATATTSTYVTARNIGTDYTTSTTLSAGTTAGAITYLTPGTYLVNAENGDKRASTIVTVGSGTKNLNLALGNLGNPPLTYVYTDGTARVGTTVTASTKVIGAPAAATLQVLTSSNVAKASSRITVKAGKRKATVRVKAAGVPAPTGKVTVRYGKKKVTKTLRAKDKGRVVVKLPRGTHKVKVSYSGSKQVLKTTSKKLKIKVR